MGNNTKERPILFSGAMVRAILDGRKTQTRRVVKPQPPAHMTDAVAYLRPDDEPQRWCFTGRQLDASGNALPVHQWKGGWPDCGPGFTCPYGIPGERLWVRESFQPLLSEGVNWGAADYETGYGYAINYVATSPVKEFYDCARDEAFSNRVTPSIFMPRWASRITLEITDVRVQRLQEITPADAIAEGISPAANSFTIDCDTENPCDGFRDLWDSINGKTHPWASNPWLWCLTFKRVTQ